MISNLSNLLQIEHINYFYLFVSSFLFSYFLALLIYLYTNTSSFQKVKIQQNHPDRKEIYHEIKWSIVSMIIWVGIAYILIYLINTGYTKIYFLFNEHSVLYFLFTIVFFAIIHDTYFYWCHRFMHSHKTIFKKTHATHHASKNPTTLSIFSFSPYEAIILGFYFILMCFFIPVHIFAVIAVFMVNSVANIIGHSGYEFFSRKFNTKIQPIFIDSIHHNLHHKYGYLNYGIYFPFWDKVMNTFHHKYKEERELFYKNKNGN